MKPKPQIFIGNPLHGGEAAFLRTLSADLADSNVLILTNFLVGNRQIDFVVIMPQFAALVELKNYRRAVIGQMNGEWRMRDAVGNIVPDMHFNPYQQTLEETYALSDTMKEYQRRHHAAPVARQSAYYSLFQSFVCFYPAIHAESNVTPGDNKVRVRSYPDVLNAIRSTTLDQSWSPGHWMAFAEQHLGLHVVTLDAAIDPRVLAADAQLSGYRHRLRSTLSAGLPPLIDAEDDIPYGSEITRTLQGPQNYILHGPTGSAKTFHLHHLAVAMAADMIEMPFLIDAKRYRGGDFWPLLRKSIAPYFASDPRILLLALAQTGVKPVLLIDALNECREMYRGELLRGVLAFALHCDARTIITTQDAGAVLNGLQADRVTMALPSSLQKRQIYAFHAGIAPSANLDRFCAGFTNAYDLVLAGRCHSAGIAPRLRVDLYDRYLASSLPVDRPVVLSALVRHIAGHMHGTLSIATSRNTCEEIAERFLSENEANLSALDSLFKSRLVDVTSDSFAFEHELLLTYLVAEHIRRSAKDVDALVREIEKPRNAKLIEFILPRVTGSDVPKLVDVVREENILRSILGGACGTAAQNALRDACAAYISAAINDLANLTASVATFIADDGRLRVSGVQVLGAREWSVQERRLANVLAFTLDDAELQPLALRLLDESESALRDCVSVAAQRAGVSFKSAWSEAVRFNGGMLSHGAMLPCSSMLNGAHTRLMPFRSGEDRSLIREILLTRVTAESRSDFALAVLLDDHEHISSPTRVSANLDLIETAWEGGLAPHRLSVLHAFPSMRSALEAGNPEDMARALDLLGGFTSTNIFLNSLIVETRSLFEVIDPPVSLDDAIADMRVVIDPRLADDTDFALVAQLHSVAVSDLIAARAYGLIASIFEDVFQGVYYAAYQDLNDDERLLLLQLAARTKERGFHTSWILRELTKCADAGSVSIFESYVRDLDFTGGFLQDDVAAAMISIEACARYSHNPPVLGSATLEYDQAFKVIGEALFWAFRNDGSAERLAALKRKWSDLDDVSRFAAGVILHYLRSADWLFVPDERAARPDLIGTYSAEVEVIALDCVNRRGELAATFNRHMFDGRLVKDMIEMLGQVGTERALPVLRVAADDPTCSSEAINALQAIQRRGIGIT